MHTEKVEAYARYTNAAHFSARRGLKRERFNLAITRLLQASLYGHGKNRLDSRDDANVLHQSLARLPKVDLSKSHVSGACHALTVFFCFAELPFVYSKIEPPLHK